MNRSSSKNIQAWFDGSLDSDGRAAFGFMIADGDRVVLTCAGYVGNGCNDSVAVEYAALDALLQWLIVNGITEAVIRGDCAPVIAGVQGHCRVSLRYQHQAALIASTCALLPLVRFEWTPRGLNSQAHILARAALRNHALMKPWGDFNYNGPPPKPKRLCAKVRRKARQFLAAIINRL